MGRLTKKKNDINNNIEPYPCPVLLNYSTLAPDKNGNVVACTLDRVYTLIQIKLVGIKF